MTSNIKQHKNKRYYITMDLDCKGYPYYIVEVCPIWSDSTCGHPIKSVVYALNDRKNALAAFNRYKRKYV